MAIILFIFSEQNIGHMWQAEQLLNTFTFLAGKNKALCLIIDVDCLNFFFLIDLTW